MRADHEDIGAELILDGFEMADELLAHHHDGRAGAGDGVPYLECGQAPVHGNGDSAQLRQTESDVKGFAPFFSMKVTLSPNPTPAAANAFAVRPDLSSSSP